MGPLPDGPNHLHCKRIRRSQFRDTHVWAGYLALANEQAAAKKLPPPGFINPKIYPLGLGKTYHTDFHDITSGGNGNPPTKGYDLTSGWGSPNTDGLINALTEK